MHVFLAGLYEDHLAISAMLKVFERELEAFAAARHPDYDVLESGLEYCSQYLDQVHHRKEEAMLERLRQRAPEVAEEAMELIPQHRNLETLTHAVLEAISAVHDDAYVSRDRLVEPAKRWLAAYRDHIAWEESKLFDMAQMHLVDTDWDAAAKGWEEEVNPLHNPSQEHRFFELAEAIREVGQY